MHFHPGPLAISSERGRPGPEVLTPSQAAIVEQLARGKSTLEASKALGISVHTLRFQLNLTYRRAQVSHRGELILWALGHGFGKGAV